MFPATTQAETTAVSELDGDLADLQNHACINSLCDFNFCVRTCLGFAAFSWRHIPQSEYDIHPVTPFSFSLIQLSRTYRIYLFMSPWTISLEPVALILASALISHSPYRCTLLCLSSSCGKKPIWLQRRERFYMTFVSDNVSVRKMVWNQKVSLQILDPRL